MEDGPKEEEATPFLPSSRRSRTIRRSTSRKIVWPAARELAFDRLVSKAGRMGISKM